MPYAEILKKIRIKRNLTVAEVADSCGITSDNLVQIENNEVIPNMILLEKLAKVYDVPLSIILTIDKDEREIEKGLSEDERKMKDIKREIIDDVYINKDFKLSEVVNSLKQLRQIKENTQVKV